MRIRSFQAWLRGAPQCRRPQLTAAAAGAPRIGRRLQRAGAGRILHRLALVITTAAAAISGPVIITWRTLLIELLQQGVHFVFGWRFGEYGRVAQHAIVQRTLRLYHTNHECLGYLISRTLIRNSSVEQRRRDVRWILQNINQICRSICLDGVCVFTNTRVVSLPHGDNFSSFSMYLSRKSFLSEKNDFGVAMPQSLPPLKVIHNFQNLTFLLHSENRDEEYSDIKNVLRYGKGPKVQFCYNYQHFTRTAHIKTTHRTGPLWRCPSVLFFQNYYQGLWKNLVSCK